MDTEEDKPAWLVSEVECYLCSKQWVAVFHIESERLECPSCGNMVDAEEVQK